jgi:ribose transport system substrate-binding protein
MAENSVKRSKWALRLGTAAALAGMTFAVPHFAASAKSTSSSPPWTLGVSNDTINNGWRDEMVCSIRAQAAASGKVKNVVVLQNQGDTAKQISQIRDLISQNVSAILVDPNSPTALNGAIQQAIGRGIKVVVIDQEVNVPGAYEVANNQRAYGRLGMQWLVNKLHGKGNIAILNGIAGAPADTARQQGQNDVLKHHPKIHVVARAYTNWDFPTGGKQMLDILNSGKKVDGVWTSGVDYTVVNAFRTTHHKLVPVVGADNNEFVHQLLTMKGLVGAVVTNPPPVGGAGAAVAIKVLSGKSVPRIQLLRPQVWANTNAQGLAQLRIHRLPSRPPSYGASWNVPGFTTYTKQQLLACG